MARAAEPDKKPEKQRYEYRDKHDPDGIGKFYMGREIAHVMGYQAAGWLDRPEREKEEQTSKMIEQLIVAAYSAAFDVGAWNSEVSYERYEKVVARSICAQETLREFVLARLK